MVFRKGKTKNAGQEKWASWLRERFVSPVSDYSLLWGMG